MVWSSDKEEELTPGMDIIPALGRLRQEDYWHFKVNIRLLEYETLSWEGKKGGREGRVCASAKQITPILLFNFYLSDYVSSIR